MKKFVKILISFVLLISIIGIINSPSVSAASAFIKPNDGVYTSPFGWRILGGKNDYHNGIDIAPGSSLAIKASAAGKVTRVTNMPVGFGNYIILRHNINGQVIDTVYAHLASTKVFEGDTVSQGTQIGVMGATGGDYKTHLHFELHPGGYRGDASSVDPKPYIDGKIAPVPTYHTYNGTWATLTVVTADGSNAANLFGNPGFGLVGSVPNGSTHSVFVKEKGSDGYNYFAIGNGYINEIHTRIQTYRATVDHTSAVNVYGAPNGAYKKRVNPGETYNVYGAVDGWYDLGQSTWIKAEYVKVVKP